MHTPEVSILLPVRNEAANIPSFFAQLCATLESCTKSWEIITVDDGSDDNSRALLKQEHFRDPRIKLLCFPRRFGKEAALSAALNLAEGAAAIPMDADFQDPIELIPAMLKHWHSGAKSVLAVRTKRDGESILRRAASNMFFRIQRQLSDPPLPHAVGDFRLIDRSIVLELRRLPERTRFMKGLFAWPGLGPHATITFERPARRKGHSQWGFFTLTRHALDGIFAFSTIPLRIWTGIGAAISLFAFMYGIFLITRTLIYGIDSPGYASLMVTVLFIGGIQLIGMGILGEYIGRIYHEVKARPMYIVEERYGFPTETSEQERR